MDMSVTEGGSLWQRLTSKAGFTAVSHIFVMEWAAVLRDIVVGLLLAGAVGAWVPESFWQSLFRSGGREMLAMMGGSPDDSSGRG